MAAYLSLEDAAKKLGVSPDRLIDLRSQGQIRGFRDGTSWKFPESEIDRMKDELPNLSGFGSGILAEDDGGSKAGAVIGGDASADDAGGSGSDLELGVEGGSADGSGSDVNLVPNEGDTGSDVAVVAGRSGSKSGSGSGPVAIDLDELELPGSAISHEDDDLDLGVNAKEMAAAPRPMEDPRQSDEFNLGSSLDMTDDESAARSEAGSAEKAEGGSSDDAQDAVASGEAADSQADQSSLDLADDMQFDAPGSQLSGKSGDVLSELDLLAGEAAGSGMLSGDSANLLDAAILRPESGGSSGVDDALADDDDLLIADDDDDLVISSAGSDISIAGDSGINLMSPSDSGLSLESEPLDLAGSSISALDLGAELGDGSGTGSGRSGSGPSSSIVPGDGSGSAVDFQADEEFQLSPSGVQLDKDQSESQVIAVEESEAFEAEEADFGDGDPFGADDPFADAGVAEPALDAEASGVDGFDAEPVQDDGFGAPADELELGGAATPAAAAVGYEVPFTVLQVVSLLMIIVVLSVGGMLMTDLVRNMWAYSETSAPVSSLTDMLISAMGWGQ